MVYKFYTSIASDAGGQVLVGPPVVGDGTTDDSFTIQQALNAAAVQTNGIAKASYVLLPPGKTYAINAQLVIPDRVVLGVIGRPRGGASIKAGSAFPSNTALIKLGGAGNSFGSRVEGIFIDALGVTGGQCVTTTTAQEQSGLIDCVLRNYQDRGFNCPTGGQGIVVENCEFFPDVGGSNYSIDVSNTCTITIKTNSLVGTGGGTNLAAIRLTGGCNATILGFHVEGHNDGVLVANNVSGLIAGGNGPTGGAQAVTNLVHFNGGSRFINVAGLLKNNATTVLLDDTIGLTRTDPYLTQYFPQPAISAGSDLAPNPVGFPATLNVDASQYTYIRVSAMTGAMTVAAPTNALRGRRLVFELLQDGTGGRVVTWNAVFKGVTLAASGTANQKAMIDYLSDGTNWYQTGTSGWQT